MQEAWLYEALHWYRCQRNTRRSAGSKAEEPLNLPARQPHHNIQRDGPGDRRNQPSSSFGGYRRVVAGCRRRGKTCLASKTLMCAAFVGHACHVPVISNNLPELVVDQVQCLPVQSRHCGSADQPWRLRGASQTKLLVWAMREPGSIEHLQESVDGLHSCLGAVRKSTKTRTIAPWWRYQGERAQIVALRCSRRSVS
ncbi:hypothetical protein ACM42_02025 [Bradyrhizobium sp. CCBAU 25338]|nr:hypothetical protein [Bradyrhizobium sp. CCBAU 45389]MDA9527244.1 hypothetical protein [Bradyrhizobium sp. CCBAU 25338]